MIIWRYNLNNGKRFDLPIAFITFYYYSFIMIDLCFYNLTFFCQIDDYQSKAFVAIMNNA